MILPGFRLVLGLYYLALGTWVGTTLMMGLAAASTFQTAREYDPALADLPATVSHHGEYFAGQIVNRGFTGMSLIQCVCAAIILLAVGLQLTVWRSRVRRGWANGARLVLLAGALAVLGGDLAYVRPQLGSLRSTRYDVDATAEERNAARATFDRYHRVSERLLGVASLAVGAAVLISPFALTGGPGRTSET